MLFVYIHIIWFGCWIGFRVEDYPFGLLTMIVSLEAIFLSTFVMISQNRADARRQVIADQQWKTVQEEDKQNRELLDLSKQILDLTKEVRALAGPGDGASRSPVSKSMVRARGRRNGEDEMAVSDQLSKLAARAKEAEDRAAAAQAKAKADLELDVENARATAQAQADNLRESADAGKVKISDWWNDVQRKWNEHVATVRENMRSEKAEIDRDRAQANADQAEADAVFAIDYAYGAIGEAEYAVLDAALARKEADERAAAAN